MPYVEVAVGRLASLFHYRLPATLNTHRLQTGSRLLVSLGARTEIAHFIRYVEQPTVSETKDVLALLDETSPLSQPLIKLLRWISEYYMAPFGAVLPLAFPKGEYRLSHLFELTEKGRSARETPSHLAEKEKAVMTLLGKGAATKEWLQKKLGKEKLKTVLSPLKRKGWVQQRVEVRVPSGPRTTTRTAVPEHFLQELFPPSHAAQEAACKAIGEAIQKGTFTPFLLQGITGSGKTLVYLRVIEIALGQNKGAIVLVPEIGLTPQLVAQFKGYFGDGVALLHSGLSPSKRREEWNRIRRKEARIVLGTRSALFAPMEAAGVIIVDEEHDPSYKQEDGVCYHARDAAVVYGQYLHAVVVLGSATPSLESLHHAILGKYNLVSLPERVAAKPPPSVKIMDLRQREEWVKPFLTRPLLTAITERLARGEQTILFINRRGHAPSLLCSLCGHTWRCQNCAVSLVFHKQEQRLLCHYCGFWTDIPSRCPRCQDIRLLAFGIGTERVEEEIKTLFPSARVLRMDRDTTSRKEAHAHIVAAMAKQKADILIGTQMVTKGHDFPAVTCVGILCADLSLNILDFRASERTFQLLTQVAGRAGRGDRPGEVFIQTFQPEQPVFHLTDCFAFYAMEKAYREEAYYPPFCQLILLQMAHREEPEAAQKAAELTAILREAALAMPRLAGIFVLGPAPAPLFRLRKEYRYQILLKGKDPAPLREVVLRGLHFIRSAPSRHLRCTVNVDPQSMQ